MSLANKTNKETKWTAVPLPSRVRVESSMPRGKIWETLSTKQKKLALHLLRAGKAGRELLFLQIHRHGLKIRNLLVESLSQKNFEKTKELLGSKGFEEYLIYAGKFMDMGGPYSNANRKFVLKEVGPETVMALLKRYANQTRKTEREEITLLLTDPNYEVLLSPESSEGEGLEEVGGNLYEKGIRGSEVRAALGKTLNVELNCRVVKTPTGLRCDKYTTKSKGMAGEKIREIVTSLEKAKPFSETEWQKKQIEYSIKYFKKGDVEDFRQASIAWVKDGQKSTVDFMIGWVEVYEDWLARMGTWESYVQIIDQEVSKTAQALASHAQYFEDNMPYGEFKKKFPANYAPPAIMVYYFQELANYRSGGYNLPNFDDIRRDVGAKNVIRLPMPGETTDPEFQNMWREALNEFCPPEKIEAVLKEREILYRVLVLLHEIIGHGSGTYDESKYDKNQDPISGLGSLGSALEEQRADLTALVFAADPKFIEVGVYKDTAHAEALAKLSYDFYLADFLRKTSRQRTFSEAHHRGHWLFINKLLKEHAIEWAAKSGKGKVTIENGVLAVKDYAKFKKVAIDLLAELQRIKAHRDRGALKTLFEDFAPLEAINEPWAQAIIKRGENLLINAGYVEQPWKVNSKLEYETFGGKSLSSIAPFWKKALRD